MSEIQEPAVPVSSALLNALAAAQEGLAAQALLERALGQALLTKMRGGNADLLQIYTALGGTDPGILAMLQNGMSAVFQTLDVTPGIQEGQRLAVSEQVRMAAASGGGGKRSAELLGNQLTQVPGQALNTLAALGGEQFATRYQVRQPAE
jgi:hypothetical protein